MMPQGEKQGAPEQQHQLCMLDASFGVAEQRGALYIQGAAEKEQD